MDPPLYPLVHPSACQRETPTSVSQREEQPTQAVATPPERTEAALETQNTPMDPGGAGDSSYRLGRGESGEWTSSLRKCCHSLSKKHDSQPAIPFPLQDYQGRVGAVQQLYQHAGEQGLASQQMAALGLKAYHPEMELEDLTSLNNQILLMIAEYHLMCTS